MVLIIYIKIFGITLFYLLHQDYTYLFHAYKLIDCLISKKYFFSVNIKYIHIFSVLLRGINVYLISILN